MTDTTKEKINAIASTNDCEHKNIMSTYTCDSSYKVCNDCNAVLDFRHTSLLKRIWNVFRREL